MCTLRHTDILKRDGLTRSRRIPVNPRLISVNPRTILGQYQDPIRSQNDPSRSWLVPGQSLLLLANPTRSILIDPTLILDNFMSFRQIPGWSKANTGQSWPIPGQSKGMLGPRTFYSFLASSHPPFWETPSTFTLAFTCTSFSTSSFLLNSRAPPAEKLEAVTNRILWS